MATGSLVLIIDYGSHTTQLIARRVRQAGVYSAVLPCTAADERIRSAKPTAIILSGDTDSVTDPDAPKFSQAILDLKVPVLAIGFGAQLLAQASGAKLAPSECKEESQVSYDIIAPSPLFQNIPNKSFTLRTSFGDTIADLPDSLEIIAKTKNNNIAGFVHKQKPLYGVQGHFEDENSEAGKSLLHNFLFTVAKLQPDWTIQAFIDRTVVECREQVGDSNVILGLSGGVDSTVVAALLYKAIGSQLHCIFVDNGLMRQNEPENVIAMFQQHMPGINLHHAKSADIFLSRLTGVENPEEKRKIIGHTFIDVFNQEAQKISNVRFLAQGTVYPDVIESYSVKGTAVKSHHNVGGLPEKMHLGLVEPLRELFKDEVRAMGTALGLPDEVVWRQPFPGPGLGVRVLGEITADRLTILRAADTIVQEELRKADLYHKIWQGFAVLLPLRTVGMRREGRTYEHVIAIRAVVSIDAMTADWARLPDTVLAAMSNRILHEVEGVNRVVYDISPKPPSTIEWE